MMIIDGLQAGGLCHCGNKVKKYAQRKFTNGINLTTIRVYYKCLYCKSKLFSDSCPELDAMPKINVFEIMKKIENDEK